VPGAAASVGAAILVVAAWIGRADALEPAQRALLLRSLRESEVATVEAATGGLDSLPTLALEVELQPEIRSFHGRARLDWPNRTGTALPDLLFRLSSNGIRAGEPPRIAWTNLKITLPGGTPRDAAVRQTAATLWRITLPNALAQGARVVIEGDLEGELPQLAPKATDPAQAGLGAVSALSGTAPATGASQYGTFACGDDICTLTGFAPEIPAFIGGRFDDDEGTGIGDPTYSEPVNLLMTVVAPQPWTVVATGVETGRVPAGGGRQRSTFAIAAGREAGIVASAKFSSEESTAAGVKVRAFARKEDESSRRRVLAAAKESLATYDASFGRYPWTELEVVESGLAGGAGGVELPGMVLVASGFYRSPEGLLAMLASPKAPGGGIWTELLDFIVRHEVAHQWWHAQVGSHAQRHPWVDEPLAQWSALHATRRTKGAAAAKRARDMQIALQFQALGGFGVGDGPAARPAGAFSSQAEYAGIVYGKAPLFYEAARGLVGEKVLVEALAGVVTRMRFRRAVPDDVRGALVKAAGAAGPRMDALWRRWFEEAHGREDVGETNPVQLLGMLGLDGLGPLLGGLPQPGAKKPGGKGSRGAMPPGLTAEQQKLFEKLLGGGGADPETMLRLMREMTEQLRKLQQDDPDASDTQPDDAWP